MPTTDATGADTNPLFTESVKQHRENVTGVGESDESINLYLSVARKMAQQVYDDPTVLDPYRLSINTRYKSIKDVTHIRHHSEMSQEEKYLYWRANPWLAAFDIIGEETLTEIMAAGKGQFKEFTSLQKLFMRDFCDPRYHKMASRRNRGGSKTHDVAVCIALMEYFVPGIRITINSGSMEQSDTLYSYFKDFIEGSDILSKLVLGIPLKKQTKFKHRGWVKALTASPKSVKGKRPDIIVFDEVCEISRQLIADALGGTWTAAAIKIIMIGTPDKMNHKFFDIQRAPIKIDDETRHDHGRTISKAEYYIYHSTCYECPWISEEAIEAAKKELDDNNFRIQMLGEFGSATGSVFDHDDIIKAKVDEWDTDDNKNFIENLLKSLIDKAVGVDWGYAHKTGVNACGVDSDDVLHVVYAKAASRIKDTVWYDNIIPAVVKKYDPSEVGADSSHAFQNRNLDDSLEPLGHGVRKRAFKSYKQVMISALRARFEKRMIKLYCGLEEIDELIEQLFAYQYHEGMDGIASDLPEKGNDDYIDALLIAAYPLRIGETDLSDEDMDFPSATDMFGYNSESSNEFDMYR